MSDPQQPHRLQPPRLLRPWGFPGRSTEVGCHCLLQEEDYTSSNYLDAQTHLKTAVNVIQETFQISLVLYLVVPWLVTEHLNTLETRSFTLSCKCSSFGKKFHVYTLTQVNQDQAVR